MPRLPHSSARPSLALATLLACACLATAGAAQDAAPPQTPVAPGAAAGTPQGAPAPAPLPPADPGAPAAPAAPQADPHAAAAGKPVDDAAAKEAARVAAAAAARALGESVLDRAAHFQRGDTPQPAPTSLHGNFHVGVRDKDGALIQADVERWFTLSPERMLTHRRESVTGSSASLGWNGSKAWFADDADKRVIVYTDDPETFGVDLDQLREQVRLTRLLLTASVMDALRPRLTDIAAVGTRDVKDLDGETHATDIVTAHVPDELFPPPAGGPPPLPGSPAPQLELRFAIDHESGAIRELQVTPLGRPDSPAILLRFDYHGPTASGLRVPGNIRVYREGSAQEELSLGVFQPAELLLFDVNAPIDAALFDPPAAASGK